MKAKATKTKSASGAPSVKGGYFADGGKTKMFGPQTAGPQDPGVSSHEVKGSGDFAVGGKTKMFGRQEAGPMPAGQSGKN